jgi:hypothetical protein
MAITIASNHISNSLVLDGVLLAGKNGHLERNEITRSGEAAVDIPGNNNTEFSNEFLTADVGILLEPEAAGNDHFGNRFFAILKQVSNAETPAASAMRTLFLIRQRRNPQ